jgi:hypothetical protein
MAEGVFTADGKPVDLDAEREDIDREFARAMAEPPGEEKAPPKRGPKAEPGPSEEKPRVDKEPPKRRGRPPGSGKAQAQPAAAASRIDRVQAVQGLIQLAAAGCLMASGRAKNPVPLKADAITLAGNSEGLATAVADAAEQDEKLARLVDKIAVAGPYGALIVVAFGVGSQLARNHGIQMPGTADPADLVKQAEAQAA